MRGRSGSRLQERVLMSALEACRSRRDEAFACGFCLEYKFVSSADAYRQESDYKRGETTYLAYDTL
jgi:hypothetical protein